MIDKLYLMYYVDIITYPCHKFKACLVLVLSSLLIKSPKAGRYLSRLILAAYLEKISSAAGDFH